MIFGKFESSEPNCPIENIQLTGHGNERVYLYESSGGNFMVRTAQKENFEVTANVVGGATATFSNVNLMTAEIVTENVGVTDK